MKFLKATSILIISVLVASCQVANTPKALSKTDKFADSASAGYVPAKVKTTKNLIIMLTDGTSTSIFPVARWYHRYMTDSLTWALNLDPYLCGLAQSRLSDAIIPDSAPAMSGFVTGVPSRVGNISIYPEPHPGQDVVPTDANRAYQPAATVLEGAKDMNKAIGVVATVIFPHATPGACTAHTASRGRYRDIAYQMASQNLSVCFGGGRNILTPEMRQIITGNGATLLEDDVNSFRNFNGDKLWAIFNDDSMDFEIDRDPADEPSLSEMTVKALDILSKNKNGFCLMVEGSKVDYGAHSKDPIEAVTEFIEFDKAFGKALEFAKKDGNTTIVVMSDHGNSGITLGDAHYQAYSSKGTDSMYFYMKNYRASSSKLSHLVKHCPQDQIPSVFKEWTGIDLKPIELEGIKASLNKTESDYMKISGSYNLNSVICSILTSRTHIGFTSGNHTGEDVFLAVYNPHNQRPTGIVTNTALNGYMCMALGMKDPLVNLTDREYVKSSEVFPDAETSVEEGEEYPTLVVKKNGKTLRIPAWHSVVYVDGKAVSTKYPSVWQKENKTFYISKSLKEYL